MTLESEELVSSSSQPETRFIHAGVQTLNNGKKSKFQQSSSSLAVANAAAALSAPGESEREKELFMKIDKVL